MVNVEPFIFQKVTAFKERLQMVDKINEIIDAVNSLDIDPEQIQAMIEEALADYYTKEEVDELLANIDFSPYYTKTEVNAIVSRVDGDVDAVEGRLDTAEGDIDALEINKQDVLTAGDGIVIDNNEVALKGWKMVPLDEWANLFEDLGGNLYQYRVKEDFMIVVKLPSTLNAAYIGANVSGNLYGYVHKLYVKGMVTPNFCITVPITVHDSSAMDNNSYKHSVGILRIAVSFTASSPYRNGLYYSYMGMSKTTEGGDACYGIYESEFTTNDYVTKYYSEDGTYPISQTGTLVSVLRRES